jgi:hypothetical protein
VGGAAARAARLGTELPKTGTSFVRDPQQAAEFYGFSPGMRLALESARPWEGRLREGSISMRLLCSVLLSIACAAGAAPAAALPVTLTLVPSSASVAAGQTLSVDVVVDGLTELVGDFEQAIALESFELDLAFDTGRLAFVSLSFGAALGDPENAGQTFLAGPGTPNATGVVEMLEFSLLTEAQLLALQVAPFTLATVEFLAGELLGETSIELVNLSGSSLGGVAGRALGDELAAPSALAVEIVPEPGAAALALAAAFGLRRRAARA